MIESMTLFAFRTKAIVVGVATASALLFANLPTTVRAEDGGKQPNADAAVSQAVLAYQLAIQGQHSKSPVLMLAAIETIGVLKSKAAPSDLKKESKDSKPNEGAASLDVAEWQEKAREYAKGDSKLLAFVEDRIEKLNSRSIINPPPGSYQQFFGSTRYTVLDAGSLAEGESAVLGNIQVTGGDFACVGVVGDINSKLQMDVMDNAGRGEGGESFRGFAIYSWTPKNAHTVSIRVSNSGRPTPYVIIGH